MALTPPLEKEIQKTICTYLFDLKHYFGWRQNTAPTVQKSGDGWQFRRMAAHTMKGTPDIILIKDGIFIGLEVKRPGGKQSDDQKEFEKKCLKAGGQYHIVTSLDDVRALGF